MRSLWALTGCLGVVVVVCVVCLQALPPMLPVPDRTIGMCVVSLRTQPTGENLVLGLVAAMLVGLPWALYWAARPSEPEPLDDGVRWRPVAWGPVRRIAGAMVLSAWLVGGLPGPAEYHLACSLDDFYPEVGSFMSCGDAHTRDVPDEVARICASERRRTQAYVGVGAAFMALWWASGWFRRRRRVRELQLDGQGIWLSRRQRQRRIPWSRVRRVLVYPGGEHPLEGHVLVFVLEEGERVRVPCAGTPRQDVIHIAEAARELASRHGPSEPWVDPALQALRRRSDMPSS